MRVRDMKKESCKRLQRSITTSEVEKVEGTITISDDDGDNDAPDGKEQQRTLPYPRDAPHDRKQPETLLYPGMLPNDKEQTETLLYPRDALHDQELPETLPYPRDAPHDKEQPNTLLDPQTLPTDKEQPGGKHTVTRTRCNKVSWPLWVERR